MSEQENTITSREHKIISEDDFYENYKPVPNPFDSDAPWDGAMLETYGAELDHVKKVLETAPETVWSVLDCDGVIIASSGFRHIDRMGYIITEVPVEPGMAVSTEPDTEWLALDLPGEEGQGDK
jgi:hypothetical protein